MAVLTDLNFEADIARVAPGQVAFWGFRSGDRGTHTSRTIMLGELSYLLDVVPGDVVHESYVDAVIKNNCLGKRTVATRKLSLQRLTELYALDPHVVLFRVLRDLWARNETNRPLLALFLALARDPLLRATATAVVRTPYGNEFARQSMKDALNNAVGDRLNKATLDKVVRNASSSWTQSGHFRGRGRKIRQKVKATPATTAFSLLLGFAVGWRGRLLFETPWAAVLDTSSDDLIDVAVDAKRLGLLDLKQSGSIIDVSFLALFTEKERELIHGAHRQAG